MGGVVLSNMLRHENQQMLNIVQATKDAYICWQQRDSVGTLHESFLVKLEVSEAVESTIGRNVATAKIVLEERGIDTSDSGNIT